jgi:hypothetical protein
MFINTSTAESLKLGAMPLRAALVFDEYCAAARVAATPIIVASSVNIRPTPTISVQHHAARSRTREGAGQAGKYESGSYFGALDPLALAPGAS